MVYMQTALTQDLFKGQHWKQKGIGVEYMLSHRYHLKVKLY